jgi:hypothetical protein
MVQQYVQQQGEPKTKKGYLLFSRPSEDFGMAASVPLIYYGSLAPQVNSQPTVSMSRSPIVIKSKKALEDTIELLRESGLLSLYSYLTVSEVLYQRVYFPKINKFGKPKEMLGDRLIEVLSETRLDKPLPNWKF